MDNKFRKGELYVVFKGVGGTVKRYTAQVLDHGPKARNVGAVCKTEVGYCS